jgi:DNA-binding transcriptional regulator YhcF (GntR family)
MLKKDSKLPSINSFSSQYAVARDTIEKAYNELRDEGVFN